jgi:hypothetical protein
MPTRQSEVVSPANFVRCPLEKRCSPLSSHVPTPIHFGKNPPRHVPQHIYQNKKFVLKHPRDLIGMALGSNQENVRNCKPPTRPGLRQIPTPRGVDQVEYMRGLMTMNR